MVEINVNLNLEKAMRVLKRKLIREGIFKELKARRFYEKPCEKRIRKEKESFKKKKRDNCVGCFTASAKKI
jgi:small subunit ribosomal protein S21